MNRFCNLKYIIAYENIICKHLHIISRRKRHFTTKAGAFTWSEINVNVNNRTHRRIADFFMFFVILINGYSIHQACAYFSANTASVKKRGGLMSYHLEEESFLCYNDSAI